MDATINTRNHEQFLKQLRMTLEVQKKISDKEWGRIKAFMEFKSASSNTVILSTKQAENSVRFFVSGILKVVHHINKVYVYDFRKKDDFLCDIVSLFSKAKSQFSFQTITDCEWIEINTGSLLQLLQINDALLTSFAKTVIVYLKQEQERTAFLRIKKAEERYTEFCKSYVEVVKYAKLGDIASFLDLTPQSLSRIRKNLFRA